MAETATVADFVAALRRCELADATGWETAADAATLARELVRTGTLTPFQARQLLRNRGDDLVVGPFLLLDRLGSGGMGYVYKARHRLMGRVVALKFIRPDRLARPDAVARFLQEVQAAARLSHPNIVQAYHAERTGRGFFLAMEFCDGRDLGKTIDNGGPLPIHLACDYAAQAAAGLQHAHELGMIHRDIKPGNLLLTTAGAVKLLDFGLARFRGEGGERLTRDGSAMGTPDFIAPEQARDSATVDIRADIYSLGCTLYFLLTAQVPFPGGTDWEKVLKHVSGSLTPIEVLRPDVPAELAAVVRRMTAREPADRYHTPAEVEAALAPFRNPVLAAAETVPSVTEFAPPFIPVVPPAATAVPVLTPSAPFAIPEPPATAPDALSTTDEIPVPPAAASETLVGSRSERTAARRKSSAGVWAAAAAVLFALAAVAVVIAWPDGKSRQQQEAEKQPEKKPDPVEPPKPPDDKKVEPNPKAEPPLVVPPGEVSPLQNRPTFRIAFHPTDANVLAVARGDYTERSPGGVEVWDRKTGEKRILNVSAAKPSVFAVAFAPDGTLFACAAGALDVGIAPAEVAVFETKTWTLVARFETEADAVFSLAFPRQDTRYLLVGTRGRVDDRPGVGTLELWDGGGGWKNKPVCLVRNTEHAHSVNGIAFDPTTRGAFYTVGWGGTVRQWALAPEKVPQLQFGMNLSGGDRPEAATGPFLCLAVSPDGDRVATGTCLGSGDRPGRRYLLVWDLREKARGPVRTFVATAEPVDVCAVAFLPDGSGVAASDKSGKVRVWDLPELKERELRAPLHPLKGGMAWGLAFSPDGKELAVGGWDGGFAGKVEFIPVADLAKK